MSINIKWNSQHQDDTGFCYVSDLFRLSGSIDHQSGRFLWIAEMGWKHESPDEKRGDSDTRSEAIQAAKDAAVEMLMQEIEVAPQPVSVIVPPIEWGEWKVFRGLKMRESKCMTFRIIKEESKYRAVLVDQFYGHSDPLDTEEKALKYCQTIAQSKVDKALEGCKIEPFRDPKGLVDALKEIVDVRGCCIESDSGEADRIIIAINALKAWEDGK